VEIAGGRTRATTDPGPYKGTNNAASVASKSKNCDPGDSLGGTRPTHKEIDGPRSSGTPQLAFEQLETVSINFENRGSGFIASLGKFSEVCNPSF